VEEQRDALLGLDAERAQGVARTADVREKVGVTRRPERRDDGRPIAVTGGEAVIEERDDRVAHARREGQRACFQSKSFQNTSMRSTMPRNLCSLSAWASQRSPSEPNCAR